MFNTRRNNESGIVLVIVIAFILMMSIVLAGLYSRNTTSALSSLEQAKRLRADMLARGGFWRAYNLMASGEDVNITDRVTLDNITYSVHYFNTGNHINSVVNY